MRRLWPYIAVLLALLLVGIRWWQSAQTTTSSVTQSASSNLATTPLAAFYQLTLADAQGRPHPLKAYQGKPVVINFWATWCEPCREEMPEISAMAQAHPEIAVLGLAVDEADAVKTFASETPVVYPLLVAELEGMPLAEALGNDKGVLPYTVVVSAEGQISQTFFGRVNRSMLEKALHLTP